MFGIQGRLTLLFVVIVTLVLGISGTYAQYSLGHELEVSSQRLRQGVLTRLQTSLPSALWDLDKAKVDNIVAAEMMPPELVSIRVYDTSVGLFSGKLRNENGTITSIENDAAPAGCCAESSRHCPAPPGQGPTVNGPGVPTPTMAPPPSEMSTGERRV